MARPRTLLPSAVALALGAALSALAAGARTAAPPPPLEPGERTEHFVLRLEEGPASAASEHGEEAEAPPLAFAEWRRRRAERGWQLELDLTFPADDLRVYAVECLTARGPRMVWREVSPGAGRTVLAEWTARGSMLRILEWGTDGSVRESFATERGAVMPLYLAELARLGRVAGGGQLVLDPLARTLERQSLRTSYAPDPDGGGFLREVELRREDESLAASYTFRGAELAGFSWQAGGWRAERVSAEEHALAMEQLAVRRARPATRGRAGARSAVKDL